MSGGGQTQPGTIFSLTDHEIYVITVSDGKDANGQVATWIMPATLVPGAPRLVAVLSPANYSHEFIKRTGRFVVNMLADDQADLLPLFGLVSGRDVDKLESVAHALTRSGIPVLADTCGWCECVVLTSMDTGDRIVYLCDIVDCELNPDKRPLRKREAFASLAPEIREALEEKQRLDGERDAARMKKVFPSG